MDELMKPILLTSAMGGVLALVLLCIKPLTKRLFSPKWQYYIWLTVLIVMVLPIKVSLPAAPVHITPTENTAVQTEHLTPAAPRQEQPQPMTFEDLSQSPAIRTPDIPIPVVRLSGFLWLTAAVLCFGYKLTKYMVFLRSIKKYSVIDRSTKNIPKKLTVRKTELLDAPLIAGLIKPTLYLPQEKIKDEDLNYILLHELTHYKRHDLLYKWFAMLVSSIHWFNPFVYIVSRQIDEECEVSCDYEVCKNLTEQQKKDYMTMILDFVQTSICKNRPLTTQMASNKKILKRKFTMMKTKKATGKFVSALSMILAVGMLSTTVFAGGVLSGLSEDNYTIEITNNGERIKLVNKPFIENDEVYVPLRELFEKYGILSSLQSYLEWDNGKISIGASFDPTPATVTMCYYNIETGSNLLTVNPSDKISPNKQYSVQMENSPLNIDGITYVPIQYMLYMLHDFYFIDYEIYDQNGNTAKSIVKMNIDEAENLSKNKTAAMTQGDSFSFKQALEKYISGSNIYYINDSYSLEYVDENTLWVWNWDNGSGINLAHTLFDRSGWWGEPNYWSWPKRIYSPEIVSNMTFEDRGFFYNLPLNN